MTSYELVVPIKLRELIDNFKPDPVQVKEIQTQALELAKGDTELVYRGMAWGSAKLSVQVEILKELLAIEMYKNIPNIKSRGRPSLKPRGINTSVMTLKKRTAGAPVQHNLGSSTKANAIDAYEQYFPVSSESPKKAAQSYLNDMGVDLNTEVGKRLAENMRKRINEVHLQSNGKRQRKWNGR